MPAWVWVVFILIAAVVTSVILTRHFMKRSGDAASQSAELKAEQLKIKTLQGMLEEERKALAEATSAKLSLAQKLKDINDWYVKASATLKVETKSDYEKLVADPVAIGNMLDDLLKPSSSRPPKG